MLFHGPLEDTIYTRTGSSVLTKLKWAFLTAVVPTFQLVDINEDSQRDSPIKIYLEYPYQPQS